ncbi:MAG: DUF58 domain-containing protein [Holophagales bacterium]|jgi:uncharacterized protein (DUF58 family)|nr:DUF58 domain-containing protein [Holophagales bacterium]
MYLWKDSRLAIRVTRLGNIYLCMTGMVGVIGVYTNNNLLYALFGLMIGLLLVSGWVSRASLRAIEPVCVEVGSLFARLKGGLRLRLSDKAPNRVRGLEIHLNIPNCRVEPGFFPGGKGDSFPTVVLSARPEKRGALQPKHVELRTTYPFGFLEKTRHFCIDTILSVAPYPGGHEKQDDGSGDFSEPDTKSGYSSPVGARPFVAGDSTNRIHWKRTAQRSEPWVRVMEGDHPKGLQLELDLTEWRPGLNFERELERLSGAILQARLQKIDTVLTILSRRGRTEAAGHIAAWRALVPLEAEATEEGSL